jgi:hypothetical protein
VTFLSVTNYDFSISEKHDGCLGSRKKHKILNPSQPILGDGEDVPENPDHRNPPIQPGGANISALLIRAHHSLTAY